MMSQSTKLFSTCYLGCKIPFAIVNLVRATFEQAFLDFRKQRRVNIDVSMFFQSSITQVSSMLHQLIKMSD